MIIERREYALTPCRFGDYWSAYDRWNRNLDEEGLLTRTLSFFYTASGPKNSIVNLSTFETLDQRRDQFARIYSRLSPEYVETVRPWYTSQESTLYEPSPIGDGVFPDHSAVERLRAQVRADGGADSIVVVETCLDLRAHGLTAYVNAFRELVAARCEIYQSNLLGTLQSVSGRLYRIMEFRWFRDSASADEYVRRSDRDSMYRDAMRQIEPYVVEAHRTYLKAAPLRWLRPMFERTESEGGLSDETSVRRAGS